jgi:uroporphyrinogen decarboxylase
MSIVDQQPKNDRYLRALNREPVDVTPVWIMRQAGRYLPEYRAIRAKAGSFMNLCTNPELACEVTLQPLRRYPLDAAILFSDILTIPDAMGMGLYFTEGEGPRFRKTIVTDVDVDTLPVLDPLQDLPYVMDAVRLIRRELNNEIPLIGFSGSPWTLATYMIEGGSSKDFARIKSMLYGNPVLLHRLLDKLTEAVLVYLEAQIDAGAQAVQIFDTWGGVLPKHAYEQFSLRYMGRVVDGINKRCNQNKRSVPVVVFTKGGGAWLEEIAGTGCQGVGLDWCADIGLAKKQVGSRVALQGNLDPCALFGSKEVIWAEVERIIREFGSGNGHIFNLGHGILPSIPPENVGYLIEAVHEISGQFKREPA